MMYGKLHKFLSLSLKTFRTQKRRFFFDLTAILRLSKDRNRMLALNKSSTSSASMLVDWSYIVLPLNGKSRTRLFLTAASGCDHMWTCDSRSSVEWFQRSCDHLRSSAIVCEPGFISVQHPLPETHEIHWYFSLTHHWFPRHQRHNN